MRTPTRLVVPSITTIWLAPTRPSRIGSTNTVLKNSGPSNAMTQNQRLRTRYRNSRRTIAQILRIGPRLGPGRLGAHEVDKDLQQRGLAQLEAGQARPRGDELLQDVLRVGAGGELDLGVLTVVVDLAHKSFVAKHLRGTAGAAVEPDDEMVSASCPLDVAECAVHEFPAARDDAQLLAQLFGLLHDVGREEDGGAVPAQLEHRVLHHLDVDAVEPRKRLVQDHECRLVEDSRDELPLLLHPFRQLLHSPPAPRGHPEALDPLARPCAP